MNAPESRSDSLLFLDGLRGLAALYVVVGHARMMLWEGYQEGYLRHRATYSFANKLAMFFFSVFNQGHVAVLFFFVLSGFVIHLSYARKLKASQETCFDWNSYLFRRFGRIYPPLVFTLLLTFILDSLGMYLKFPVYSQHTPYTIINVAVIPTYNIYTLLGNLLFFMKSLVPVWGTNGPLWSLHYEWWFYMFYPIFWLLSKKSIALATIPLLFFFGISFLPVAWNNFIFSDVLSMMLSWWFGVLLADVYTKRINTKFSYVALLSFAALLLRIIPVNNLCAVDTLYALSFTGILAFCFHLLEQGKSLELLNRLKPLGDMSYTLYVTHFPILAFFSGWLMSRSQERTLPMHFGWLVVGVICVSIFAYFAHFLVEKPFTKRKMLGIAT